ncbi:VOC family protein [Angustibacter sp. McL0619]|uniref:VOC family protein n=1 Tax=Angustibacter sp. McL0619 TaxID=3415676 RepID=UPI003CED8A93
MSTAFEHVVVNARDVDAQAAWWARALGWSESFRDEWEVDIEAPPGDAPLRVVFVHVPDAPAHRNRVHLDLGSRDEAHHRETVARLLASGATGADIGQGDVPWDVLRDPEGNLFCVLEPRPAYDRGAVAAVVVQAVDPERMVAFWQAATGWERSDTELVALRSPGGMFLELYPVDDRPVGLDRLHLDVRPTSGSPQLDEVARLGTLGAEPLDIGQGAVPWQVMADPEGNAFCVLSTPTEPADG